MNDASFLAGHSILVEFGSLYSLRAKKIAEDSTLGSSSFQARTSATISISDLLDIFNEMYSDILPKVVLEHYGVDRITTKLEESVKYSFLGQNANNADNSALSVAKEMEMNKKICIDPQS